MESGRLYICATPIGNMEDITLRVLRILREVDYIAAEDTKHTLKLLNHYGITKPLVSYHQHNQQKRANISLNCWNKETMSRWYQIPECRAYPIQDTVGCIGSERGIYVTVVPAPRPVCLLVLSGMNTDRFVFEGFLPKTKG